MPASLGQQIVDLYHATVNAELRQMPFDARSRRAFAIWQQRARPTLLRLLGRLPAERCALRLERELVEETAVYRRTRLRYWTRPGLQATAWLFTPRHGRRQVPGVLCVHGHSAGGMDETIDPTSIYHGFGRRFAEAGCIVLCPEQIGFHERALPEGKVTYQVLTHGLNMLGQTLLGWRHWDLVRALDLLCGLPRVDPRCVGMMGLSLGGEMTLLTSALDRRVRAACICGYVTSHRHTFLDRPHCTCGCLRDLALHFEHTDLAALIAPRPLFLDSGRRDESFPTADAEAVIAALRPVYELYGRPTAHLGIEIHDGAHEIATRESVPWLLARLREAAG